MNGNPLETKVPDGEYVVRLRRVESGTAYGSKRWFCHMVIESEGAWWGKTLVRVYNKPSKPWLPRSHNLFLDYVRLTGLLPPSGMTPAKLLDGISVIASVVTVDEVIVKGKSEKTPEALHYSKIDKFERIDAGTPPCMRGRVKGQT